MDNSITSYGLKNVDTKRWRLAPLNLFCVTVLRVPCWRGLWRREGIIQIFNLTMSPEKWQKHHHVESHSYFIWLDRSLSWLAATTPCLSWCFSLWWLYDCFAPGCGNGDWDEKKMNRCKAVRHFCRSLINDYGQIFHWSSQTCSGSIGCSVVTMLWITYKQAYMPYESSRSCSALQIIREPIKCGSWSYGKT